MERGRGNRTFKRETSACVKDGEQVREIQHFPGAQLAPVTGKEDSTRLMEDGRRGEKIK